ncbi:MAG: RluA family pseudouridine synthase [Tissierellales bacterium]|jgi:23S rRNA pseudouridine1911/1915/1917 synthase|nr:RluA family pseudouridine synthase [Tissierellales bacterium]
MMLKYELCVEEEDLRLDKYLSEELEEYSRSYVNKLIKEGFIKVNGRIVKPKYLVKSDDKIEVEIPEPVELKIEAENLPIEIVYEDEELAVVNKPKNMVVHPAPGHYSKTLVNGLLYHLDHLSNINGVKRPGIVHRIDKNTTGLLMIAKTNRAHQSLTEQLKEHSTHRVYHCIVHGNIKEDEGTIDLPIGRHPKDRKKMAVTAQNSKRAVTHFKVIERFGDYTYVENKLETGRTHQIRVHMAHTGHPLLGDDIYGPKKTKFNLEGQTLHAKEIGFIHPTLEKQMVFNSELPEYFQKLLRYFRDRK